HLGNRLRMLCKSSRKLHSIRCTLATGYECCANPLENCTLFGAPWLHATKTVQILPKIALYSVHLGYTLRRLCKFSRKLHSIRCTLATRYEDCANSPENCTLFGA